MEKTIGKNTKKYGVKVNKNIAKDFLFLSLAALMMATGVHYFLIPAGVLSAGISGVTQGISLTMWTTWGSHVNGWTYNQFNNVVYWSIYIAFNIPIFIWTLKKFSNKFAIGSVYIVILTSAIGLFYTFTPGFSAISLIPGYKPFAPQSTLIGNNSNLTETAMWGIVFAIAIISAVFAAALYGGGVGLAWKKGYCSMGIDPFSRYLANQKNINAGKTLMYFSLISASFWLLLNFGIEGGITSWTTFLFVFISPYFLAMIVFLFIYSKIVQASYGGKIKVAVEINTKEKEKILNEIKKEKWFRNYTTLKNVKNESEIIVIYANKPEVNLVIDKICELDGRAFITVKKVDQIIGEYDNRSKVD